MLLFDADAAGDTAVNRAVELFLTQPVEIAIAALPDGMDPDEYLLAHGAEAFEAVLRSAADALTFTWKQLARQFKASGENLTGQQRAVQQYLEMLNKARSGGPVDGIRWGSALSRVSRLTDIPVDELNRRFSQNPTAAAPSGRQQDDRPYGQPWQPRKPYNPYRDDPNGVGKGQFKKGGGGGPIGSGRGGYRRDDGPPPYRPPAGTPPPVTARDTAERWILAVLLSEPHRWSGLVDRVHVTDFLDPARRKLADLYWQQQQDEGEPVFNELLGLLQAASEEEGSHDLASLAVGLHDELADRTADPDAGVDAGTLLAEALRLLDEIRSDGERDKLVAQLRRTSGAAVDAAESLRQLQERARRPDLRRVRS